MRILFLVLVMLMGLLQYKAWRSDVGRESAARLRAQLAEETARADAQAERNRRLTAEVLAFKRGAADGYAAVEARARTDLGMVGQGEQLFLFPDGPLAAARGPEAPRPAPPLAGANAGDAP
jgi:cell division protein FtsB